MSHDALKLTTYAGERDRASGRFLADALVDVYARACLRASVVLRGVEGFGVRHQLQTDRLLSLSEDLPVVTVAVDERERIEALLGEVERLMGHGLLTLERARLLDDGPLPQDAKLTLYVGRQERTPDGRLASRALVELLHAHGVAGATVLLGVDGTSRGERAGRAFSAATRACR